MAPDSAPAGRKTLDVGLAIVTVGMAWWYRAYSQEQTAEERGQCEFAEFESKSQAGRLVEGRRSDAPMELAADGPYRATSAQERACIRIGTLCRTTGST